MAKIFLIWLNNTLLQKQATFYITSWYESAERQRREPQHNWYPTLTGNEAWCSDNHGMAALKSNGQPRVPRAVKRCVGDTFKWKQNKYAFNQFTRRKKNNQLASKKKIKKKKPLNGVLQTETMKTQGAMKDRDSAGGTTEADQMVSLTSFGF